MVEIKRSIKRLIGEHQNRSKKYKHRICVAQWKTNTMEKKFRFSHKTKWTHKKMRYAKLEKLMLFFCGPLEL